MFSKRFCCGGTHDTAGKFVDAPNWRKFKLRDEIKPLDGGGFCTQHIYRDICGGEDIEDCTEADDASCTASGGTVRNKACLTKMCEPGEAFESASSNTCIPCPLTTTQGPRDPRTADKEPAKGMICERCNPVLEFYDPHAQKCINKDKASTKLNKTAIKACWRCPFTHFKTCATQMALHPDAPSTGVSNWSTVAEKCKLK